MSSKIDPKIHIDSLFKIISRFDFYFNTTNTKTAFILAFNAFTIGSFALKYDDILKPFAPSYDWCIIAAIFLTLIFASSILSVYFAFKVVNPFLKSPVTIEYSSTIFFNDIVRLESADQYIKKFGELEQDKFVEDLERQVFTLAQGLSSKFDNLKYSIGFIIFGTIPCLAALLFLKILHSILLFIFPI